MQQLANIVRKSQKINPVFGYSAEVLRWRPRSNLNIAQWTERNRVLSADSEEKGPMRLRRTPYLRPILNAFQDPDIETIVLAKAAQIGATQGMISVIGYYADQEPGPIMMVLADEDTANYMSINRLRPMFVNSPKLAHLSEDSKFHKSEIYLINGCYICMGWASSVAKMASRSIRILILDEVDKPGYYLVTKEAGPISLAINRTVTFYNRKIGILSTPTIETGNIWRELQSCDVVFDWHIPCPHCGQFQPLRFSAQYSAGFPDQVYWDENGQAHKLGSVVWQGGRHATDDQIEAAGYRCGECEKIFNTTQKNIAVEKGKMIARKTPAGKPRKVGFHINRLYSLLGKSGHFPMIIRDWINSLDDPKKLQDIINSTFAEPWKQTIIKSTEETILKARADLDPQTVPAAAIALTAAIDPQKYGFWFVVRAWSKNFDSWLIHYGLLTSWLEVENLLFNTRYPIAGNEEKSRAIWRACLDTGGGRGQNDYDPSMTEAAYVWLRDNAIGRGCMVYGIKGATRPLAGKIHVGKNLDQTPSGQPLPGGLRLIHIDTDQLKDQFHFRLKNAIDGNIQAAYLHKETGLDYAKQILAEEKIVNERGLQVWQAIRRDNHFLDCECMAAVAADPEFVGGGINILDLAEAEADRRRKAVVERKKAARPARDWREYRPKFLDR